jgi:ribonuclease HI
MKKIDAKPFVEIYADGACSGNPGAGGFGAILRSGEMQELFDAEINDKQPDGDDGDYRPEA